MCRETFFDHGFHNIECVRGIGTRFYDCCISGCNGIDQRVKSEQNRVIPWTHDQHGSVRRRGTEALCCKLGDRGGNTFAAHKAAEMLLHPGKLGQRQPDLTHITLHTALSKILLQCRSEVGFMADHSLLQTF